MFSIGEFARLGQVSVKMLRHYDAIGLLRPARIDRASGYRYYISGQLPRLNQIVLLRDLGFRLREIASLSERDAADAYARRERDMLDTIAADQRRLARLRARRASLHGGIPIDVVVRAVPRQLMATTTGREFDELERYVQAYRARADAAPLTFIGDQVTAAVPVTRPVPDDDRVRVQTLPAVPAMACLLHRGGYTGLSASWQALLTWVDYADAEPQPGLREVYLNFGAEPDLALRPDYLTDRPDDYLTELQVPIAA